MFAKRLLRKAMHPSQSNVEHGSVTSTDLDPRIALHYGIPSTASILAFDPIQRLLAIGTLDGRIKIIGGDNIEGLLMSPKQLSYKYLEFLHNQGFLVGVSNDNDIQVWDLEHRCVACCLPWDSNITAFSVIFGTQFMYIGDEYGLMSVLKYDAEEGKLLRLPYYILANSVAEAAGISLPSHQSIVGILPQPYTSGNRVLIAYENGLIILWDVSEGQVVLHRGYKDLQLKESPNGVSNEPPDDISNNEEEEKEICSLCWASSNGSILAVGYVDGDIMLWNTSNTSSTKGPQPGASPNNVFKLQLSSAQRKLPVIVLHWSANRSQSDHGGQLFIYGGDEIGSEEVLTVLNLDWSSGIQTLRCLSRVDLSLNGSFADMILLPHAGATENNNTSALFILTNPGLLHVYDDSCLSSLTSQREKGPSIPPVQFPSVIPTIDPSMTVAKLCFLPGGTNSSKVLSEMASAMKTGVKSTLTSCNEWALTGGVPSQLSFSETNRVERIYLSGYQDGSVRVWDATYPVLSLILVLDGEVQGIEVADAGASVSALDFCSLSSTLAVGNERGLVRVYMLNTSSIEMGFHLVTETNHEVHTMHQEKGLQITAVFSFINSPVQTLKFEKSGAKLAVGFECGQVAVFDMSSFSLKFLTNCSSGSSSAVISVTMKAFLDIQSLINSPKFSTVENPNDPIEEVVLVLTRNAHILVINGASGNLISSCPTHVKESTAISIDVIGGSNSVSKASHEKHPQHLPHEITVQNDSAPSNTGGGIKPDEVELHISSETPYSGEMLLDQIVVLCCEDTVRLYSLKSVIQGDNNSIHKVNLSKPCCWATTFKKDGIVCGLILFYRTGAIEIRSLPDLEVVGESSLMSLLRWSFKTNMDKMMSSYDNGQITLANGFELAFISFLAFENDFRIPESLPCLHDKVLAAAADAAINVSSSQSRKQFAAPGILGGIIKGFKGGKLGHAENLSGSTQVTTDLGNIFSRSPFSDPSDIIDGQEVVELDIDDIEIEEPEPVASTSSHQGKNDKKDKETDRQKLFEGGTVDQTPRLRTPEEIIAKYRHGGDVAAVAAQARDRLAQRQEKLERLSRRTEELQNGAENFASMANELVKTMEGRKWWKI